MAREAPLLAVWTVYDHPSDYPAGFIARRFLCGSGQAVATTKTIYGSTLDDVRELLPPGLTCFPRSPGDEPQIVECWL